MGLIAIVVTQRKLRIKMSIPAQISSTGAQRRQNRSRQLRVLFHALCQSGQCGPLYQSWFVDNPAFSRVRDL